MEPAMEMEKEKRQPELFSKKESKAVKRFPYEESKGGKFGGKVTEDTTLPLRVDEHDPRRTLAEAISSEIGREFKAEDLSLIKGRSVDSLKKVASVFKKKLVVVQNKRPDIYSFPALITDKDPTAIFMEADQDTHPHLVVMGHELTHTLKADNPHSYDKLRTNLGILDEGFEIYAKNYETRFGPTSKPEMEEELVADYVGQRFAASEFWDSMMKKEPTLFASVIPTVRGILKEILPRFEPDDVTPYFSDIKKAEEAVSDAVGKYAREQNKEQLPLSDETGA
jgi:hypothetical protein